MGRGVRVEIWSDYALWSRPEMKVERVSYDVITPSAARGILESIFWKPEIKWRIKRIYVMNPIRMTNIRRNEVKSKISARNVKSIMDSQGVGGPLFIDTKADIQQRASLLLKDVRYVIDAEFDLTDSTGERGCEEKYYAIIMRRLRNGQCYSQPYAGCREFPVHFRLWEEEEIPVAYNNEIKDLGFILYDLDYTDRENIEPMFFRAVLRDGVLDLTDCEVFR